MPDARSPPICTERAPIFFSELPESNIVVGDEPLIVSEFGAEGRVGVNGPKDKLWNLDSQLAIFEEQFRMFDRCGALSGIMPWVLEDFRSTLRTNGFQHGWNCKGLVGRNGEKKPVFDFVRRAFAEKMANPRDRSPAPEPVLAGDGPDVLAGVPSAEQPPLAASWVGAERL